MEQPVQAVANGVLFRNEVFTLVGAAYKVYNTLKSGLQEVVYQEALEIELALQNIPFVAQPHLEICYEGQILKHFLIPDLMVYREIIVELKAIPAFGKPEEAQLLNYLKIGTKRVGVLINFGRHDKMEWRRLVR